MAGLVTYCFPPVDLVPLVDTTAGASVLRLQNIDTFTGDEYDQTHFRTSYFFAGGLYARIRRWHFTAFITAFLKSDTSQYREGVIDLYLDAVKTPNDNVLSTATVDREEDLPLMAGWAGHGDQADWVDQDANALDPIFLGMCLFPNLAIPTVTSVDRAHVAIGMGFAPTIEFNPWYGLFGGTGTAEFDSIQWGQRFGEDDCPCEIFLPSTDHGSFDNTGVTGFTLQLGGEQEIDPFGGPVTYAYIEGTSALEPSLFWAHDPGDGLGPLYHTDTGLFTTRPRLHLPSPPNV